MGSEKFFYLPLPTFQFSFYISEVVMNNKKEKEHLSRQGGFTLIEVLVVMFIIALLASLVAPKMFGRVGQAKQKAASAQIEMLGTALDSYRLDVGIYPETSEGLQALLKSPSGIETWNGPYLKKEEIPLDPWGNPYHYESPGSHGDYDLYSYGRDNAAGGDGEDADILSWKTTK